MEKTETKIKTERSREAEKWRESKAKGDKGRVRQKKEIKTAAMGRAKDRGESPFLQSLQSGFLRVWAPLAFLRFP